LYYLALNEQTGNFPYHLGLGFEIRGLMETLFYCLQSDRSGVVSGTENTDILALAFERAFGFPEIDCSSGEISVSTTTEETENHQSTNTEVSIISALITTVILVF
jgi:hypothetical protein